MIAETSMVAAIMLPLSGALACFLIPRRARVLGPLTAVVTLADVAALAAVLPRTGALRYEIGAWQPPLGIALHADGLSALMLLAAGVTGTAISVYAAAYFRPGEEGVRGYWPLSLLLWTALNALFLSADMFNLYVTLELLGIAAVTLVALAGGKDALAAAMRYLLVTFLGSLSYLLGVALLYHLTGALDIRMIGAVLEPGASAWLALGLIGAALILKSALFPLHFWLPPAHSSATTPVSAFLSALVVKASIYLFVRLWLDLMPDDSGAFGLVLGAFGAIGVVWGSLQALRQRRLKLLIAYSTVAQVGYFFLPFALGASAAAAGAWRGATYLIVCHALAKTAMFLAAGNMQRFDGHDDIAELDRVARSLPMTLAAFGIAGVTLMGLPPSGGFTAKWLLLEASIAGGQWWLVPVILGGGLLAAAYVFKVVGLAFTPGHVERPPQRLPATLAWVPFGLAVATVLLAFAAPPLLALLEVGDPFANLARERAE